ncbi:MAG: hypothetical protein JWM31_3645, partial [Solirubrobacterales bacterium]|nr:hypothetical protein [Solirubrobacterales bacterium]
LAVVPVLMALRTGRLRALTVCGAVCAAVMGPALLHGTAATASVGAVAHQAGTIFQPWQWTWFLGHHGAVVQGTFGAKPGYRTAPGALAPLGHLPTLLVPLAVSALAWRRSADPRRDALLVLALVLLLRCVVDPWDTAYYTLPFLLALAAHEVVVRGRAPIGAALATVAVYGSMVMARDAASPDVQAALFLAWSVPAVALLGGLVFVPAHAVRLTDRLTAAARVGIPSLARAFGAAPEDAQSTTVSSLLSPLSTSCPSSVTITRSSMRTPTAPGT